MRKIILTSLAVILVFELPVYAYFDPGTGSMLLQFLAGGALIIGVCWRFIFAFFKKLFKKKKDIS